MLSIEEALSQNEYRARDGISSSDIRQILENPFMYKNKIERKSTPTMNKGSLIHCLLLEPENLERDFYILPKGTRTDKTLNAGERIVISYDIYEQAKQCVEAVRERGVLKRLLTNGKAELSCFKKMSVNGKEYDFKCRPDYYLQEKGLILDIKTASQKGGGNPDEFMRSVAKYGYYIQAYLYLSILEAKEFYFIVVETEAPYMLGIYKLDPQTLDFARGEVERALRIYENLGKYDGGIYLDTDDYARVQTIGLPNWVYYKKGVSI